jgi:putrescine transport system substrate-binding protein
MVEAVKPIREYIATFDNANYLTDAAQWRTVRRQHLVGRLWRGQGAGGRGRDRAEPGLFHPKPARRPGSTSGRFRWMPEMSTTRTASWTIMLRPEVIAACTNFTGYANANKAAMPFVDPAIAADPGRLSGCGGNGADLHADPANPEQESDMNRAWTEIKTGG